MLSQSAQSATSTGADSVCDSPLQTSRSLALLYLFVSFYFFFEQANVSSCTAMQAYTRLGSDLSSMAFNRDSSDHIKRT